MMRLTEISKNNSNWENNMWQVNDGIYTNSGETVPKNILEAESLYKEFLNELSALGVMVYVDGVALDGNVQYCLTDKSKDLEWEPIDLYGFVACSQDPNYEYQKLIAHKWVDLNKSSTLCQPNKYRKRRI